MRWSDLFIHLGEDIVIRSSDVVAILDWQLSDNFDNLNEFVKQHKRNNTLVDIGNDGTKSIVITSDLVYLSPLSSLTLKRRTEITADIYLMND